MIEIHDGIMFVFYPTVTYISGHVAISHTVDYYKRASILVQAHPFGSAAPEQGPPSHIPGLGTGPLHVAAWHGDRTDADTNYSSCPSEHP